MFISLLDNCVVFSSHCISYRKLEPIILEKVTDVTNAREENSAYFIKLIMPADEFLGELILC